MAALGLRRRIRIGPALHIAPLPLGGLSLSAVLHAGFIAAVVMAVSSLQESEPKMIVVNLVPQVAAIGSPQSQAPARPVTAPPTTEPARPAPAPPRELPPPRPSPPPRELPPRTVNAARDLPPRELPSRPTERALPPRIPSSSPPLPPASEKDLPTVASAKTPTSAAPPPPPAPPRAIPAASGVAPAAPPPPGLPVGSPVGAGKVTVEGDFPYAWYLAVLSRKINEKWNGRDLPGNQPRVVFEIERDGRVNVNKLKVEKSSGNPAYDQVAMRTIADALPFPPLPADFKLNYLRIHIEFDYGRGG